jgi:hypothetical protein
VLLCRAARVAVAGYYPLLFPGHGQRGLAWLGETAAALGPQALTILKAACKEGEVVLPTRVQINLCDGKVIHLGPSLTCPNKTLVKRCPAISVTKDEDKICLNYNLTLKPEEEEEEDVELEGYLPEETEVEVEDDDQDVEKDQVEVERGGEPATRGSVGREEQEDVLEEGTAATLRLRGGSGRAAPAPGRPPAPRQLQQAVNPFRLATAQRTAL